MAKVSFPITNFQDSDGNPVSFGYVLLRISTDVKTPVPDQIGALFVSRINLDVDGNVTNSPLVWPNLELTPSGSEYIYNVYSQFGQQLAANIFITV